MPPVHLLGVAHLVLIALWGGVVATEAVIEITPFFRRDLHEQAIRFHYWIDLLVELPLLLGVLASGLMLAARLWPLSAAHLVKIGCVSVPLAANLTCVAFVLRRRRALDEGAEAAVLRRGTRRIIACAAVGLPFAAVGATLGFWLSFHRMAPLLRG